MLSSSGPTKVRSRWTAADSEKLRNLMVVQGADAREHILAAFPEFSQRLVIKNIVLMKKSLEDLWTEAQDQLLLKGVLRGRCDWEALRCKKLPSKSLDAVLRRVNHFREMLKLKPISYGESEQTKNDPLGSQASTRMTLCGDEDPSISHAPSDSTGLFSDLDGLSAVVSIKNKNAYHSVIKHSECFDPEDIEIKQKFSEGAIASEPGRTNDKVELLEGLLEEELLSPATWLHNGRGPAIAGEEDEYLELFNSQPTLREAIEHDFLSTEFWNSPG